VIFLAALMHDGKHHLNAAVSTAIEEEATQKGRDFQAAQATTKNSAWTMHHTNCKPICAWRSAQ
jgi:hypothetical protein